MPERAFVPGLSPFRPRSKDVKHETGVSPHARVYRRTTTKGPAHVMPTDPSLATPDLREANLLRFGYGSDHH
jgi:hypothetical protein